MASVSGLDRKPLEVHIDSPMDSLKGYQVVILWSLMNTEYVHHHFDKYSQAREYIEERFGKNHGIPVLR